ncbi:MAG: RecX family transcriptional regulator [Pseudomonadota bacterium]|nr:RecX family transcriptional regulator [Pseudomonadota bacterium]
MANNKKAIKNLTHKSLERAALYHLKRYSSSSENLRRVLIRRVLREFSQLDANMSIYKEWVNEIVEKLISIGLLNDERYAEMKCLSLHKSGKSQYQIRNKLLEYGLSVAVVEHSLKMLNNYQVDCELIAAVITARRKKLGPYRTADKKNLAKNHDMAKFARAGFSYGIATRIMEFSNPEDLDEELEMLRKQ